jgi:hypothetical protein
MNSTSLEIGYWPDSHYLQCFKCPLLTPEVQAGHWMCLVFSDSCIWPFLISHRLWNDHLTCDLEARNHHFGDIINTRHDINKSPPVLLSHWSHLVKVDTHHRFLHRNQTLRSMFGNMIPKGRKGRNLHFHCKIDESMSNPTLIVSLRFCPHKHCPHADW